MLLSRSLRVKYNTLTRLHVLSSRRFLHTSGSLFARRPTNGSSSSRRKGGRGGRFSAESLGRVDRELQGIQAANDAVELARLADEGENAPDASNWDIYFPGE
jgi:hypothetical protein